MPEANLGYYEDPVNGDGINRARTTRLIRSWMFAKSAETLDKYNRELGQIQYPGLYVLFETTSNKVYIGEAGSLYDRIKQHSNTPDDKIKNWSQVLIINDGRSSSHSEFNDSVIRRQIEHHLNQLFKLNKFKVVSQSSVQNLNAAQKVMIESFIEELNFFLVRKNLINKLPALQNQQECSIDEMTKLLKRKGCNITDVTSYEAKVNGKKSYIRPGSKKPKGWQITFRDKFKNSLNSEDGFLIVPRGGVLVIPLPTIKQCVSNDASAFSKNTIDIFVQYTDDKVIVAYKEFNIEVTQYLLKP